MSPGYFNLLLRELDDAEVMHFLPGAGVQAMLYNTLGRAEGNPPATPFDFIPGWEFDIPKTERNIATPMDLRALFGSRPVGERGHDTKRTIRRAGRTPRKGTETNNASGA